MSKVRRETLSIEKVLERQGIRIMEPKKRVMIVSEVCRNDPTNTLAFDWDRVIALAAQNPAVKVWYDAIERARKDDPDDYGAGGVECEHSYSYELCDELAPFVLSKPYGDIELLDTVTMYVE